MPEQLPAISTPLAADSLAKALVVAWRQLFGEPPARAAILVLLAQVRHETGLKSCWAWNLGNAKHIDGDGRNWCMLRAWEIEHGVKVWREMSFRAYRSLEEGAVDYLSLLRKRFAHAWPFVLAGDPAGFVHALKQQGYFTDLEERYRASVVAAFNLYAATLEFDLNPPLIDDETRARVEGLVALSLHELSGAETIVPPAPDDEPDPITERTTLPDS